MPDIKTDAIRAVLDANIAIGKRMGLVVQVEEEAVSELDAILQRLGAQDEQLAVMRDKHRQIIAEAANNDGTDPDPWAV